VIVQLAAKAGKKIQAFHTGGMVTGYGEQLAMLKGGEGVLSGMGMARIGGAGMLNRLNRITVPPMRSPELLVPRSGAAAHGGDVHHHTHSTVIEIKALDAVDVERIYKTRIRPQMKMDALLNSGGLTQALATATARNAPRHQVIR
jgi:hypothetical protein